MEIRRIIKFLKSFDFFLKKIRTIVDIQLTFFHNEKWNKESIDSFSQILLIPKYSFSTTIIV